MFMGIRVRLTALEQNSQLSIGRSPRKGLIVALLLGVTLSIFLSLLVEVASGASGVVLDIIVAPLTEEFFKGLSILIVVLLVWKTVPNRRWAAAVGASVGLGFAIGETIVQAIINGGTLAIVARIIAEPFMHPLWSAFAGMGLFVLLAKKSTDKTVLSGLGILFVFMGLVAHMTWNAIAVALAPSIGVGAVVVDLFSVFLLFAIVLRDLLGGHFNFLNFLEPLLEPSTYPQINPPPPPPPPPL